MINKTADAVEELEASLAALVNDHIARKQALETLESANGLLEQAKGQLVQLKAAIPSYVKYDRLGRIMSISPPADPSEPGSSGAGEDESSDEAASSSGAAVQACKPHAVVLGTLPNQADMQIGLFQ